LKRQAA